VGSCRENHHDARRLPLLSQIISYPPVLFGRTDRKSAPILGLGYSPDAPKYALTTSAGAPFVEGSPT